MKNIFVYLILFCLSAVSVQSQDIPANDAQLLDKLMHSRIKVEIAPIESDTLAKIFAGKYYRVTPAYQRSDGTSSYCEEYLMAIKDDAAHELEQTSTNMPLEVMFSLLKEGVTIKNETEAKIFEAALDHLYPMSWPDNLEDKKHMKEENKWLFLRGDFMGSKKGFLITMDANSRITWIEYSLELVKNE